MVFTQAIVRKPCQNMIHGLSGADLGAPDFDLAVEQHNAYTDALISCGLEVLILEEDEEYPDSTFVEDTALLTPNLAVITRPGAPSRRGETRGIEVALKQFYTKIERIRTPGTLEAGDVMMVGSHLYIGLSQRTNEAGANQLIELLKQHNLTGSVIRLKEFLHLKSGLAYLENNHLALTGEFLHHPEFRKFNQLIIPSDERYATNCVWINGTVLIAAGFPKTKDIIQASGYPTISLNMSEFQKLDGGLSCLSLRF